MTDPFRTLDDPGRALALHLLTEARFGALGVLARPGQPMVTRVACLWSGERMLLLVSTLSAHTAALEADPATSLLIGEPGPKGDPLTHPRLTLLGRTEQADKAAWRERWLEMHPKSALYIDFADFRIFGLIPSEGYLNGGFGKAYRLTRTEIAAL